MKKEGTKIQLINIIRFIEYGEVANVTIGGQKYDLCVNKENGKYYIDEESY